MGIDIYMTWDDMTEDDVENQFTGFDTTAGDIGYLREAYHGAPYATEVLVPEAFTWTEQIGGLMETAEMAGQALPPLLSDMLTRGVPMRAEVLEDRLQDAMNTCRARYAALYPDATDEHVQEAVASYVSFVFLARRLQNDGKSIYIYASY